MPNIPLTYSKADGTKDGTLVLKLTGPMTLSTVHVLQEEMRELKPQLLIFDLTDSPYMDSAGLGVLMNYYVSAQKNGRRIALTGVNPRIAMLLEVTRVNTLLPVFPDAAAAEA